MHDLWIERFNKEVLPFIVKELHPSKVLFWGSRVTGDATVHSDIDVIIISDSFKDIPFINRMERVMKLARFPKHVDYLCYTPEEFMNVKVSSSIVDSALKDCVEAVL